MNITGSKITKMELCVIGIIFSILISFSCQATISASSSMSPSDGRVLEGHGVVLSCSFPSGQNTDICWRIDHIISEEKFLLEGKK